VTDASLIADVVSTRQPWTGTALAGTYQWLVDAIESEGWVDDLIAGGAFGIEIAATVMDPFSALLANGLGWAMEYFEPLRQILDELTGMPDVVASHAATWSTMTTALQRMAADLKSCVDGDLPQWQGLAATAYHDLMEHNVHAIDGLGGICAAMTAATQAAGNLVTFTRDIVRDLIADLVARVIVWAIEAIFVVTIPVIASQIAAAVVKWSGRILTYVMALITSLTNLAKLIGS
jgi:uncharacterized protein YukE